MRKILTALILSSLTVLLLILVLLGSRRLLDPGHAAASSDSLQKQGLIFTSSGQKLGISDSRDVALGDLDGDGDLDAVVANSGAGNRVWLNDGTGFFTDSGQSMGLSNTYGVALGNLDGVDSLDAIFANYDQPNSVWFNDGSGTFNDSSQALGSAPSNSVALGFLDDDADLDAFIANGSAISTSNKVWLNIGGGVFTDSLQLMGSSWSEAVALGKLDADDDLDAFVANGMSVDSPDRIWINEGSGVYSSTHEVPASIWSTDVALGKLDADDDLDAFTASWNPPKNKVWLNQGDGAFIDSGQGLGSSGSTAVALGDLDGDNDIDAFVGNFAISNTIWLNDGFGIFTEGDTGLTAEGTWAVALGDLDGDGDLDVFLANNGSNTVWLNKQIDLPGARFDVNRETNDRDHDVFYSSVTKLILPILLDTPAPEKLAVHVNINSPSSSVTKTLVVEAGQQMLMLSLTAELPDPAEQHILTLWVTQPGSPTPGSDSATDWLVLYFVDPPEKEEECFLCLNTWLAWHTGIVPIFDALYYLDLTEQRNSAQWRYYNALFKVYTPEMIDIISSHPPVLWSALKTFNDWTPAIEALDEGTGAKEIISQSMVDNALNLLDKLQEEAKPGLQAAIERERDAVDIAAFKGLNMDRAWDRLAVQRPTDKLFITIILQGQAEP